MSAVEQTVEVTVDGGRLRGERTETLAVFRGVPFAAPPFGADRFCSPRPVPRWHGVREALVFGPGCPQPRLELNAEKAGYFNPVITGYDCLNLNVWTPDPGGRGLPVMVWIHGGGFISGSGSALAHDGTTWARDGVVFVSINYRMHVEGFCHFGSDTANLGLQDQVAALRWVQANIASFGGDPDNVTVFGQSAGGVSVMYLLAMPSATGLFRRAIAQSGSSAAALTPQAAAKIVARLGELVGAPPTPDALAALPDERLISAAANLAFEYLSPALWGSGAFLVSPFRPVIDGEVLGDEAVPSVRAGAGATVDVMAGTTRDETSFAMDPLGLLDDVGDTWAAMALDAFGLTLEDLDIYRKVSRPDAGRSELFQAAWTDWAFRIPTLRLLEARRDHAGRTFAYQFDWPSPTRPAVGAVHALELPFVFDQLDAFCAAMPPNDNPVGDTPPQEIADRMHHAWVAFATTGDPGWAPYHPTRTTMRFDTTDEVIDDLAGAERELWSGRR